MYTTPYRDWLFTRLSIADDIFDRYKETGEIDATILLCCALATLAAMRWPGRERDLDMRRFIEFLTRFAPETKHISIPILITKLYEQNHDDSAARLIATFFQHEHHYDGKFRFGDGPLPQTLLLPVLDGTQIDQHETSVIDLVSRDERKWVRKASYAAIMYTDLRCGLVHEYHPYEPVASRGMSRRRDVPSYVNMQFLPNEEDVKSAAKEYQVPIEDAWNALTKARRHLYFPYEYVRNTVVNAADHAFNDWDQWPEPDNYQSSNAWAENKPQPWWITAYGK